MVANRALWEPIRHRDRYGGVRKVGQWMGLRPGEMEEDIGAFGAFGAGGAVQDLLALNIDMASVMQAGRWKSNRMPMRYGEHVLAASATAHNIGQLAAVAGYGYSEGLTYDTLSRLSNRSISITGDQNYQFDYTYNTLGGVATIAYPTSPMPAGTGPRYTIQYQYSYGYPYQIQDITNASSPTTIWALGSANDYSSPLTETLGTAAGATTITSTYKPWTDQVLSIQSGVGGSLSNRQNLAYLWDVDDNLTQRKDLTQSLTETFTPDALNRLSSSTLNGISNLAVTYDAAGDITSRSDVGSYSYSDSVHPHGVTAAGSNSYTYDANGNVANRNGLANTWASYNLPTLLQSSVSGSTLSSELSYGPEHQRFQQIATELNGTETTRYVGGLLEKMIATTTGLNYWRHYVNTPTGRIVIVTRNSDFSTSTNLVLSDHLGSSDAIVDGLTGALNVQESFSPFGLRRQSNWTAGTPSYWDQVAITESTRHGFTGHEHLDNVALIHMNGRVYDPAIGRFLSVDPDPGEPGNSQRLNPYSYVSNRPLVATDPTGLADNVGPESTQNGEQRNDSSPGDDGQAHDRLIERVAQNDTGGAGNVVNNSAQPSTQPQAPVQAAAATATLGTVLEPIGVTATRIVQAVGETLGDVIVMAGRVVSAPVTAGALLLTPSSNKNGGCSDFTSVCSTRSQGTNNNPPSTTDSTTGTPQSTTASPNTPDPNNDDKDKKKKDDNRDDKQKHGKPGDNQRQNRMAQDAAKREGLKPGTREYEQYRREVEYEARQQGVSHTFDDLRELARAAAKGEL